MLILPDVAVADAPLRIDVVLQVIDPLLLLFFADVHEEFQYQVSVIRELTLETADARDAFLIKGIGHGSVEPAHHDLIHPAGVIKAEFARFRKCFKIAAEERFSLLQICRHIKGRDLIKTRVDVIDDIADQGALPGRAPAFDEDHHRELIIFDLILVNEQKIFLFF